MTSKAIFSMAHEVMWKSIFRFLMLQLINFSCALLKKGKPSKLAKLANDLPITERGANCAVVAALFWNSKCFDWFLESADQKEVKDFWWSHKGCQASSTYTYLPPRFLNLESPIFYTLIISFSEKSSLFLMLINSHQMRRFLTAQLIKKEREKKNT